MVKASDFSLVPSGVIALWSGSIDSVPLGWALCDGNNGTPDLRDRFVIGAGSSNGVGDSGGSLTTDGHTLTEDELASHKHEISRNNSAPGASGSDSGPKPEEDYNPSVYPSSYVASEAGGDSAHSHSYMPPYYALAYIMKL